MGIVIARTKLRAATARWFEQPIARTLMWLKIGPSAVTLFGLALASVAAYLVAVDELVWAGAVLLTSGALDSVDGALARMSGTASTAGALMDSVVDRVSEAVVLLGVLVLALDGDDTTLATLVYLALAGSMLVSYVLARAQALGSAKAVGVMTRPERVVVLAVGLLSGYLTIAVGVIAVLALLTALHRFLHGWNELRKGSGD